MSTITLKARGRGWFDVVRNGVPVNERAMRRADAENLACQLTETAAAHHSPSMTCLCGCGLATASKRMFKQGHDARLKSILLGVARGTRDASEVPDIARPHLGAVAPRLLGRHLSHSEIDDLLGAL